MNKKTYRVFIETPTIHIYKIEASSPERAETLVMEGYGEDIGIIPADQDDFECVEVREDGKD